MEEENQVEQPVVPTTTPEEIPAPSQDPVADELARVQKKDQGRSKREKLEYTKARVDSQLAELDAEEGNTPAVSGDKSAPMTVAMYENLEKERAQKSALQMADEITDANERDLVKHHIENTIRPSGNPNEDLRVAKALVNAVKNGQLLEETARVSTPSRAPASPGAPARLPQQQEELTSDELLFMRPPFNMTKDQVIKARPR